MGKLLFIYFFTDSSLQVSQQGPKTQGVTKEEEKRRIEVEESEWSVSEQHVRPDFQTPPDFLSSETRPEK